MDFIGAVNGYPGTQSDSRILTDDDVQQHLMRGVIAAADAGEYEAARQLIDLVELWRGVAGDYRVRPIPIIGTVQ